MVLELFGEHGDPARPRAVAAQRARPAVRCLRTRRWTNSACSTASCCGSGRTAPPPPPPVFDDPVDALAALTADPTRCPPAGDGPRSSLAGVVSRPLRCSLGGAGDGPAPYAWRRGRARRARGRPRRSAGPHSSAAARRARRIRRQRGRRCYRALWRCRRPPRPAGSPLPGHPARPGCCCGRGGRRDGCRARTGRRAHGSVRADRHRPDRRADRRGRRRRACGSTCPRTAIAAAHRRGRAPSAVPLLPAGRAAPGRAAPARSSPPTPPSSSPPTRARTCCHPPSWPSAPPRPRRTSPGCPAAAPWSRPWPHRSRPRPGGAAGRARCSLRSSRRCCSCAPAGSPTRRRRAHTSLAGAATATVWSRRRALATGAGRPAGGCARPARGRGGGRRSRSAGPPDVASPVVRRAVDITRRRAHRRRGPAGPRRRGCLRPGPRAVSGVAAVVALVALLAPGARARCALRAVRGLRRPSPSAPDPALPSGCACPRRTPWPPDAASGSP